MKRILLGWAAVCGMASLAEAQYSYCVTNSDPTGAGWTYVNQASGYRHNSCNSYGSSEVKATLSGISARLVFNKRTDSFGYPTWIEILWAPNTYTGGILSISQYTENSGGGSTTLLAGYTTTGTPGSGSEIIAVYRNNNNQGSVGRGILITAGGTTVFYPLAASFDGQTGEVLVNNVSLASIGAIETTLPGAVSAGSMATSWTGGQLYASWTGVSDAGIGRVRYEVYKGSIKVRDVDTTSTNFAVGPGELFDLKVRAYDGHRNFSAEAVKTGVSTPPATSGLWDDSRRIGVHALGSYWGGGGEQIDVRSMNLNYSQGMLSVIGRAGAKLGIGLSYNSQQWRKENSTIWKIGGDVGLGFGWRLMAGSVTPIWSGPATFSHYLFTDATGAEYKLDSVSSGVWKGKEGTYVWYDANAQRLYFKDGSYWQMDCISGISEADAGARYPTRVFDRHGNYVELVYMSVNNGSYNNQTSRIWFIYDARSGAGPVTPAYNFQWNVDAVPHLTAIAPQYGNNAEHYAFGYSADAALIEPFNNSTQFGTAKRLTSLVQGQSTRTQSFEYSNAGEMTKTIFPFGGELRWSYITQSFSGGKQMREVGTRSLVMNSGGTVHNYNFTHSSPASLKMHADTTVVDASGIGRRVWQFSTAADFKQGLEMRYDEDDYSGGTWKTLARRENTWAQQGTSQQRYVSEVLSTMDVGLASQKQTKTTQTIDEYGNVTVSNFFGFASLSTPLRTTSCSYLHTGNSNYINRYLLGFSTGCTTTEGGVSLSSATLTYDGFGAGMAAMPGGTGWWVNPETNYRALVTSANDGFRTVATSYNLAGQGISSFDGVNYTEATTYGGVGGSMVPTAMTPNGNANLGSTINWDNMLRTTGAANGAGASTSMGYYSDGRPSGSTSPHGANTQFFYNDSLRRTMISTPTKFKQQTSDGLGRVVKEEMISGTVQWTVETEYEPCACSPMGKVKRVSLPYAPGGTKYWTVYTFDGLGRTVSIAQPNGAGTTTYLYEGNQVTVTSPSGKWKKYEMNALGQLVKVIEPRPAGGTYETNYTYNVAGKLLTVNMVRDGVTQNRTFSYDTNQYSRSRLVSASNPENGTVNYVYNNDATLQAKTDAKNIKTEYSYDSYKRPTQMRKLLWNGSAHVEDRCQRVDYTYDGGGGANYGKLTKMRWSWDASAQPCALPGSNGTAGFEENYTYTAAGLVLSKTLSVSRNGATNTWNLASGYTYNNEGAMLTMTYPAHRETYWDPNVSNYVTADRSMATTNTLGSLGRLASFTATPVGGVSTPATIASGAQYNHFSALTSLNVLGSTETRTYNVLGQLTRITGLGLDLEYTFSATQNDGKITAQKNWVSGEEVAYQYDSLERLISAVTTGPQWGLSFSYDGFGNRLSQTVTKGTAPSNSVLVDGTTNRISSAGFVYDLNGNMTNMPTNTATLSYDASNRMTQYSGTNIQEAYAYAPDNKRIWRSNTMRGCEVPNTPGQSQPTPTAGDAIIFYSAHGLKLGVYCLKEAFGVRFQIASEQNLYFGGRFVARVGLLRNVVSIGTDRLHSTQSQGGHFPYGEFKSGGATAQDKEEFATYTRDRSGLDYADQRAYMPVIGRFISMDRLDRSAEVNNPGSWNRASYAHDEPINLLDPDGLSPITTSEWAKCVFRMPMWHVGNPSEMSRWIEKCSETKGPMVELNTKLSVLQERESTGSGARQVNKKYEQGISCNSTSARIIESMKSNFARFGSFSGEAAGARHQVTFGHAPIQVGATIQIGHTVLMPISQLDRPVSTINTSVTVSHAGTNEFSFTTNEGHPLYPGDITFRAWDIEGGGIKFSITVSADFSSATDWFLFNFLGGAAVEDTIWANLFLQVSKECGN